MPPIPPPHDSFYQSSIISPSYKKLVRLLNIVRHFNINEVGEIDFPKEVFIEMELNEIRVLIFVWIVAIAHAKHEMVLPIGINPLGEDIDFDLL